MQFFTRALRTVSLLTAVTLAIGLLIAPGVFARPSVPLVQVSTDPFTNSGSSHQTEVEPDTYSYGATIISTFQVGRSTSAVGGGASNIGWATSTDSGATWVHGFLPSTTVYATPPGPANRISDPSVAYDAAHGVWLIQTIPLDANGNVTAVWVSRSTDGGLTWGPPISTVNQNGLDKNWIACDNGHNSPYFGHCYGEWDNNAGGNLMQMSTSADGGLTWGPVRTPSGSPSGLGGQPVVQPNGTVVVPYSANNSAIRSFMSTDGGATWSAAVTVSSVSSHGVAGGLRTSPLPSAEVDPQGRVYVAWQDCRFRTGCASNDIVFSSSLDGTTWSAVTRVPIDAVSSTVDHFIPGLAVNWMRSGPPAYLALTYYYYPTASCSVSTCQLMVGFTSSADGGTTWSAPTQLAGPMSLTWIAQSNQGPMVGDYISTSFSRDGLAHTVFAVGNTPGAQLDEAMYSPVSGLPLVTLDPTSKLGMTNRAGGDKQVFFGVSDRPLPAELPTAH